MSKAKGNGIATPADWRAAARAERIGRAEPLLLPSGATILAARPGPMEWIISGRIPQRLLAAALETECGDSAAPDRAVMTREEILELARFATQLVTASVLEPAIGDGPGEIPLEEIPLEDRAFIFEWACRALGEARSDRITAHSHAAGGKEVSIPPAGIEGFRSK